MGSTRGDRRRGRRLIGRQPPGFHPVRAMPARGRDPQSSGTFPGEEAGRDEQETYAARAGRRIGRNRRRRLDHLRGRDDRHFRDPQHHRRHRSDLEVELLHRQCQVLPQRPQDLGLDCPADRRGRAVRRLRHRGGQQRRAVAGIVVVSINAIAQLFFIPASPFWALAIFALDLLVIYGLAAYGGRPTLNRATWRPQRNPMLLPTLIAIPLLLIWVLTLVDLSRRHDLSTGRKVLWALFVLVLPVIGVIIYFVARPPQPTDRTAALDSDARFADESMRAAPRARIGVGRRTTARGGPAARARDGLGARRCVELAVDRVGLRLDRVGRDVEPRGHLAEREVGRQQAQHPQLRGRQRRRADDRGGGVGVDLRRGLLDPGGEDDGVRRRRAARARPRRGARGADDVAQAQRRAGEDHPDLGHVPGHEVVHGLEQACGLGAVVLGRVEWPRWAWVSAATARDEAHRRVVGEPEALDLRARPGRQLGGRGSSRRPRSRAGRAERGTAR